MPQVSLIESVVSTHVVNSTHSIHEDLFAPSQTLILGYRNGMHRTEYSALIPSKTINNACFVHYGTFTVLQYINIALNMYEYANKCIFEL